MQWWVRKFSLRLEENTIVVLSGIPLLHAPDLQDYRYKTKTNCGLTQPDLSSWRKCRTLIYSMSTVLSEKVWRRCSVISLLPAGLVVSGRTVMQPK